MPTDHSTAAGSKSASKPYAVGKGKPPKEHQFKPGNKRGGRKAGSRNRTDFDKLHDELVTIGEDRLGRPIRKRWREVINRQLLQKAAKGDLAAIRIVKEYELKQAALARSYGLPPPTPAEIAQGQAEEAEKRMLAARFVAMLERVEAAKRDGAPRMAFRDGKLVAAEPPSPDGVAEISEDPG